MNNEHSINWNYCFYLVVFLNPILTISPTGDNCCYEERHFFLHLHLLFVHVPLQLHLLTARFQQPMQWQSVCFPMCSFNFVCQKFYIIHNDMKILFLWNIPNSHDSLYILASLPILTSTLHNNRGISINNWYS